MRIVFIDLHCNPFLVRPFYQILSGNKVPTFKHRYILDYALKHKIQLCNLISDSGSTFPKANLLLITKSRLFKRLENNIVLFKNELPFYQIQILTNVNQILPQDILIAYYHNNREMNVAKNVTECDLKVIMGNHFIRITQYADLSSMGATYFVNEVDLTNNDFIQKYFNLKNVTNLVMPYVFNPRFKKLKDLSKRKNKAMAVGTLSEIKNKADYKQYLEYAKTPWIQPMRKEILEHKSELAEYIDSFISYIYEDKTYHIDDQDHIINKYCKKIYNFFHAWKQSQYTSFNMVDKFNEYKMFICPEEFVGLPGIGFVEGMACGTAYIGLEHEMYICLGLIPNQHYIAYDGTIADLQSKIQYYQLHSEQLNTIAQRGYEFVLENFNCNIVAEKFYKNIMKEC